MYVCFGSPAGYFAARIYKSKFLTPILSSLQDWYFDQFSYEMKDLIFYVF